MGFFGWFWKRQPSGLSRKEILKSIIESTASFETLLLKSQFHVLLDLIQKTRQNAEELRDMERDRAKINDCAYIISRLKILKKIVEAVEYYSSKTAGNIQERDREMENFKYTIEQIKPNLANLQY